MLGVVALVFVDFYQLEIPALTGNLIDGLVNGNIDRFGIIDIDLWITGALTKIIARYTVNSEGSVSSGGFAAS